MILEGADEESRRRGDEEHRSKDKERRNAQPGREIRRRDPAGRRWRSAHGGQICAGFEPHRQDASRAPLGETIRRTQVYFATVAPTTASHCLAITSLATFCSSSVGNFAPAELSAGGSAASTLAGAFLVSTRLLKRI